MISCDRFTCVSMHGCLKLGDDILLCTTSFLMLHTSVNNGFIFEYRAEVNEGAHSLTSKDVFSSRSLNV